MSDTESKKSAVKRQYTPYDFPAWMRFIQGANAGIAALNDLDFGTDLCELISEDLTFNPDGSSEYLTRCVIAKTIAIVSGEEIRRDTLREVFSFVEWTENTWQKVDAAATQILRKALNREAIGPASMPVGMTRAKIMYEICQHAAQELYGGHTTGNRTSGQSTNQTVSHNAFTRSTMPEEPDYERLQRHGLPSNLLVTYEKCPIVTAVSPELLKKSTDISKIYRDEDKYNGDKQYESMRNKLNIFRRTCDFYGISVDEHAAVLPVMLDGPARDYYGTSMSRTISFGQAILLLCEYFETDDRRTDYKDEWNLLNFNDYRALHPEQNVPDALNGFMDHITRLAKALPTYFETDEMMCDALRKACIGMDEIRSVWSNPPRQYRQMCIAIRTQYRISTAGRRTAPTTYLTDRTYEGKAKRYEKKYTGSTTKKCFICGKPNCRSWKHTKDEQDASRRKYLSDNPRASTRQYYTFLGHEEGFDPDADNECSDEGTDDNLSVYFTVDDPGSTVADHLNKEATMHALSAFLPTTVPSSPPDELVMSDEGAGCFMLQASPNDPRFLGFMPDTGASTISTAGRPQLDAFKRAYPDTPVKWTISNTTIRFGKGRTQTLGSVNLMTPIGRIDFHVVPIDTPFLICLRDLQRLQIVYDTAQGQLFQQGRVLTLTQRGGHHWLELPTDTCQAYFLTEIELRRLHRRFGHPDAGRLASILDRAGQEFDLVAIKRLTDYCHHCQIHGQSPRRFRFSVTGPFEYNSGVIMDIMTLNSRPVLHLVDEATAFQAAVFLKDYSARSTWTAFKRAWIDTYLGPPDFVMHDAGKNFASDEFRQNARIFDIQIREVPVEAHHSIGKVERYHQVLRRAYEIITTEAPAISAEDALQSAVKAINDTAGPDGLVPTLLVFGAYPRMTASSAPASSIQARATAIQKAMTEVRRLKAQRQVRDAIHQRNGPNIDSTLRLAIGSDVLVWRENGKWTGPHTLISIEGTECTVQVGNHTASFRATSVKPYLRDDSNTVDDTPPSGFEHPVSRSPSPIHADDDYEPDAQPAPTRKRGRPRGSKNKPRQVQASHMTLVHDEPRVFLSEKEKADAALSRSLREKGVITTLGEPFEASTRIEWDSLVDSTVLLERYDSDTHAGKRIFRSRMVHEIKGKDTAQPYEKTRIVVMGYNDSGKAKVLTQSPTVQRVSQRLILALTPSLHHDLGFELALRDITQAYLQSKQPLQREIYARIPKEVSHMYPPQTIMRIVKPLYGIPESGNYWWEDYSNHHTRALALCVSTYDPCLLYSGAGDSAKAIVAIQTDDTLAIGNAQYFEREAEKLVEAGYPAKPLTTLTSKNHLAFNGCIVKYDEKSLTVQPKGQSDKIRLVPTSGDIAEEYRRQRARGAYIALICQPEAQFDLATAAQIQEPDTTTAKTLNQRLSWQQKNSARGLRYIRLNLEQVRLFVFVDASFANNLDLTSQIGHVTVLGNEEEVAPFKRQLRGNVIHWASTKCKRVTRSTLASEIYAMVTGADIAHALKTTLDRILASLGFPCAPVIICTDSYSLYECLVKLGTTKEKRLMIDVLGLRQSYERREIDEVRWIEGTCNPADAMTKTSPNKSLTTLIDTNELTVTMQGWVTRNQRMESG